MAPALRTCMCRLACAHTNVLPAKMNSAYRSTLPLINQKCGVEAASLVFTYLARFINSSGDQSDTGTVPTVAGEVTYSASRLILEWLSVFLLINGIGCWAICP